MKKSLISKFVASAICFASVNSLALAGEILPLRKAQTGELIEFPAFKLALDLTLCGNGPIAGVFCSSCEDNVLALDSSEAKALPIESCRTTEEQYSRYASKVNLLSLNYREVISEITIAKSSGCSSCGGSGSGIESLKALSFEKIRTFRDVNEYGSLGSGTCSSADAHLTMFTNADGIPVAHYFNPANQGIRSHKKSGSDYIDNYYGATRHLQFFNKNDASLADISAASFDSSEKVTDFANADYGVLTTKDGTQMIFEIFITNDNTDPALRTYAGRLRFIKQLTGYGISFSYLDSYSATSATSLDKRRFDKIQDSQGRQIDVSWTSTLVGSNYAIQSVSLAGSDQNVNYTYLNGKMSKATYADGSEATISWGVTVDGLTEAIIFEPRAAAMHRNKRVLFTSASGAILNHDHGDGIQHFNSASLLCKAVIQNGEVSYLALSSATTYGGNARKVYEAGGKLRLVGLNTSKHYSDWDYDGTIEDPFDRFSGSFESKHRSIPAQYYSSNRKAMPKYFTDSDGQTRSFKYSSDGTLRSRQYADGTFEFMTHDSFNNRTLFRDRLGRITKAAYNDKNQIESRTTGYAMQSLHQVNTTAPGLVTRSYAISGISALPDFSILTPYATERMDDITLPTQVALDNFAVSFDGDINITTGGDYTFFLKSDDGSRLYIDGALVVDNDGVHGSTEISGIATLAAGKHSIRVEYFEKSGAEKLVVQWQGADSNNTKNPIPHSLLSHDFVQDEVEEVATADLRTESWAYYPEGHANQFLLKTHTDHLDRKTEYFYNGNNLLTSITTPDDAGTGRLTKVTYTYDGAGRVATSNDGAVYVINTDGTTGRKSTYDYDDVGRHEKTTYHDGSSEITTFDQVTGLVDTRTDRNGNVTKYDHDDNGRRTETITAYNTLDAVSQTCTYKEGTNLRESCTTAGDKREFSYDYRNRTKSTTSHVDANMSLTSSTVYHHNRVLYTEDAYGRRTYMAYRDSDKALIRTVRDLIPGSVAALCPQGWYAEVNAITRDLNDNPSYSVTDYDLDSEGQQLAVIDNRNIRHETQYDVHGRGVVRIADATGIAQTSITKYDLMNNAVESIDPEGNKTVVSYTARYMRESVTVGENTDSNKSILPAISWNTYLEDGRASTSTDFKGFVSTNYWHNCCGRFQASKDTIGNGSISNNDYYGNVTHQISVSTVANSAANYHDPIDADTLTEVTTRFDARHRVVARTVWKAALGQVDCNNVPIAGDAGYDAELGFTTRYDYFDSVLATNNTIIEAALTKLAGGAAYFNADADGSAVMVTNPEGEVSVQIMDGAGRTVFSGVFGKTVTP